MPDVLAKRKTPATVAALLLALFISYQLVLTARDGLALLYAAPATRLMDQWQDTEASIEDVDEVFLPAPEEWDAVLHNGERALELAPHNPVYHAELGRLYQFKLQDESLEIEEIEELNAKVLGYHQQAAFLRPTWPYHWWDIAATEYDSYQSHTETFRTALRNVARFAPWGTDTQYFVAGMSLEIWEALDSVNQDAAMDNFERGFQRQESVITELLDDYEAWNTICESLENSDNESARLRTRTNRKCTATARQPLAIKSITTK